MFETANPPISVPLVFCAHGRKHHRYETKRRTASKAKSFVVVVAFAPVAPVALCREFTAKEEKATIMSVVQAPKFKVVLAGDQFIGKETLVEKLFSHGRA